MQQFPQTSVNENAAKIIREEVIPRSEALNIGVLRLGNGATILDMGIDYPGSWTAGKYFAEIGLGGLGQVNFGKFRLGKFLTPSVEVKVTHPAIAEMAAHVAYWKFTYQERNIVLSGPIRAIKGADVFARSVAYRDNRAKTAAACIQTTEMPDEGLTGYLAEAAGIEPENLYILAARTGTIAGAVQVCARNVEQTLPTLYDRGFAMDKVIQANGSAPVVSIVDDEEIAYGRVNDCLIYGQETNVFLRCRDEEILAILEDVPFSKNCDVYGTSFQDLFAQCQNDWALVPRDWDAPCKVNFFNLSTGNSFSTGQIGYEPLTKAFLG